jgi:hypothetical protein
VPVATLNPVAQAELAKQYRNTLARFYSYLVAVEQIVIEDFPDRDAPPSMVTRYHVDALAGLTSQLSAIVEGYLPK